MTWTDEVSKQLTDCGVTVEVSETFGHLTVDVPLDDWVAAVTSARDHLGLRFFDWLSAVDEQSEGFRIVCHVYDPDAHRGILLRTSLAEGQVRVASITGVFKGAAWHERETAEMFGVVFDGHPSLTPLLLPDGFEGHPLRKDFVLAARAAKAWPGAKEPGESDSDAAPSRRKTLPPGVPDPQTWGPRSVDEVTP